MNHTLYNISSKLSKDITKVIKAYLDITLLSLKDNYDINIVILENIDMIHINVSLRINKDTLSLIDNMYFTATSGVSRYTLYDNAKSIISNFKNIIYGFLFVDKDIQKETIDTIDTNNKKAILKNLYNYKKFVCEDYGYYKDNNDTLYGVNVMITL
jgi:hypothetical protein